MFEELMTKGEDITDSPHEKIMILKNKITHGWNQIIAESEKIVEKSKSFDVGIIKKSLVSLVPEYSPDNQEEEETFNFIKTKHKNL